MCDLDAKAEALKRGNSGKCTSSQIQIYVIIITVDPCFTCSSLVLPDGMQYISEIAKCPFRAVSSLEMEPYSAPVFGKYRSLNNWHCSIRDLVTHCCSLF
jgi:hypothetical protein